MICKYIDKKHSGAYGATIAVLLLFSSVVSLPIIQMSSAQENWLEGYDQRIQLVIDNNDIPQNLTNFPLLIKLSNMSGINDTDATDFFDELQDNYMKIALTNSDGITQNYVEVDHYNLTLQQATLWAQVNLTTTTDNIFYLYYDNDAADNENFVNFNPIIFSEATLWETGEPTYVMVHHFTGINLRDSTSGWQNVLGETITNYKVAGLAGMAVDLERSNSDYMYMAIRLSQEGSGYVTYPALPEGFSESGATFEIIVKPESLPSTSGSRQTLMNKWLTDNELREWSIEFYHDGVHLQLRAFWSSDGTNYVYEVANIDSVTAGNWYNIVVTWAPGQGNSHFYINGQEVSKNNNGYVTSLYNGYAPFEVGRCSHQTGRSFDGIVDELRIANTVASIVYVDVNYQNYLDNLVTYLEKEDYVAPPIFSDDFEDGTLDSWGTTIVSAGETITIETNQAYNGAYSVDCSSNGDGGYEYAFAKYYTDPIASTVYVRGYFKAPNHGMAATSDSIAFLRLRNGTTTIALAGLYSHSGVPYWWLEGRDGSSYVDIRTTSAANNLTGWNCIELYWKYDSTNGEYALYVNGDTIYQTSSRNTANYGLVSEISAGLVVGYNLDDATVYMDSIVYDGKYIGTKDPSPDPDPEPDTLNLPGSGDIDRSTSGYLYDPWTYKEDVVPKWLNFSETWNGTRGYTTSYEVIGNSSHAEAWDIVLFKFGNTSAPPVMIDAFLHGNEYYGEELLYNIMVWLMENADTDSNAQYILDNTHLLIVPCVNYRFGRTNYNIPGWMIADDPGDDGDFCGVNLNRNFNITWPSYKSDDNSAEYSGTSADSEAESQALINAWLSYEPRIYWDLHHGTGPYTSTMALNYTAEADMRNVLLGYLPTAYSVFGVTSAWNTQDHNYYNFSSIGLAQSGAMYRADALSLMSEVYGNTWSNGQDKRDYLSEGGQGFKNGMATLLSIAVAVQS